MGTFIDRLLELTKQSFINYGRTQIKRLPIIVIILRIKPVYSTTCILKVFIFNSARVVCWIIVRRLNEKFVGLALTKTLLT